MTIRDYTTLSVSQIDDSVAAFALSSDVLPRIIERSLAICKAGLTLLEEFMTKNKSRCDWVLSTGGGSAFIRILNSDGSPVDDRQFALTLIEKGGLFTVPGECFADGKDEDNNDNDDYLRLDGYNALKPLEKYKIVLS